MSSRLPRLTALVTGANRGIGLEVSRQLALLGHTVFLGSRSSERGAEAARALVDAGGDVRPLRIDVADPNSIAAAATEVEAAVDRVDIVVNNAAIHYDTANQATDPDLELVHEAMETNVYGAWHVVLAFLPLLRQSARGRIVNVSSGAGALSDMGGSLPGVPAVQGEPERVDPHVGSRAER